MDAACSLTSDEVAMLWQLLAPRAAQTIRKLLTYALLRLGGLSLRQVGALLTLGNFQATA